MPPKVAALVYVGFILWFFRRQSKIIGRMSPGLWIAFIWVTIIASRPVGYWIQSGNAAAAFSDSSGGSFIDRNTYLILILLGLCVLAKRSVPWSYALPRMAALALFYGYLMISVTWSDFPFIAFKRWFKDSGNIVMILIILTEENPIQAIRGLFVRCACVLMTVSVLFIKYYPDLGRYYHRWTWSTLYCGITTNKNSLGDAAMMGSFFLVWNLAEMFDFSEGKRRIFQCWPELLILAMCAWLLHISQCATGVFCVVIGLGIYFAAKRPWFRRNLAQFSLCGLALAAVIVAVTAIPSLRAVLAGLLDRDVTLTGRTEIWAAVLKLDTNPLIGHGFASAWLTPAGRALSESVGFPHAHNGYLETYMHSGFIGVFLLLGAIVAAGKNAANELGRETKMGRLFLALFVVGVVYNYTEVSFNDSNIVGFCLWMMAAYGVARMYIEAREEESMAAVAGSLEDDPETAAAGPLGNAV